MTNLGKTLQISYEVSKIWPLTHMHMHITHMHMHIPVHASGFLQLSDNLVRD